MVAHRRGRQRTAQRRAGRSSKNPVRRPPGASRCIEDRARMSSFSMHTTRCQMGPANGDRRSTMDTHRERGLAQRWKAMGSQDARDMDRREQQEQGCGQGPGRGRDRDMVKDADAGCAKANKKKAKMAQEGQRESARGAKVRVSIVGSQTCKMLAAASWPPSYATPATALTSHPPASTPTLALPPAAFPSLPCPQVSGPGPQLPSSPSGVSSAPPNLAFHRRTGPQTTFHSSSTSTSITADHSCRRPAWPRPDDPRSSTAKRQQPRRPEPLDGLPPQAQRWTVQRPVEM
ncbi:hypothetical protein BP6252_03043 [Coleophoma cylindrospora]|uniref:Uncharacterized protein n=1 Tax=Coleophoma cylindrospora TaxID=1849047 RepID=A0A3D8S779_9HELO|nr:hypothetical protein BP6252_03043 [Coleophoma cylindrospora]